jgi:hypothetical protein
MKKIMLGIVGMVGMLMLVGSVGAADYRYIGKSYDGDVWVIDHSSIKSLGRGWYTCTVGIRPSGGIAKGCTIRVSTDYKSVFDVCSDPEGNIQTGSGRVIEIVPNGMMELVLQHVVNSYR